MIVTELVSNCLKHAYPEGTEGEVAVSVRNRRKARIRTGSERQGCRNTGAMRTGRTPKSFGLDLVRALVDQLDGHMEICGVNGTDVRIRFKEVKKSRGGAAI